MWGRRSRIIHDALPYLSMRIVIPSSTEVLNISRHRKTALQPSASLGDNKHLVIAIHEPVLALSADRRLVFRNGGVKKISRRSQREEEILRELLDAERKFSRIRNALRRGASLDADPSEPSRLGAAGRFVE